MCPLVAFPFCFFVSVHFYETRGDELHFPHFCPPVWHAADVAPVRGQLVRDPPAGPRRPVWLPGALEKLEEAYARRGFPCRPVPLPPRLVSPL